MSTAAPESSGLSVRGQRQLSATRWWFIYLTIVGAGIAITLFAYTRAVQPYLGLSAGLFGMLLVLWLVRPRAALALTIALPLVGDLVTVSWFPMAKNLSSIESTLYIADSVSITPLEITLATGLLITGARRAAHGMTVLRRTPLNRVIFVFTVFVVLGYVRGLSSGGDSRAAIYEGRALFYLPMLYVLIGMLCQTKRDLHMMLATAMVATFVHAVLSIEYLVGLSPLVREDLESLTEHGASVGMALLLAMFLTALSYEGVRGRLRWALFVAATPVAYVFLVSQRRAAMVALAGALIMLAVSLAWRQPRTFVKIVPIALIIATGYIGAFWNSTSDLAFPAQAAKSVIAPDQLSAEDQSSNIYRQIETYDLHVTIRSSPVFGLGFGKAFLRPVPLPSIDFFELNAYLPHNSILWIWIKLGFVGFAALFYLIARSIHLGAMRLRRQADGVDALVAMAAVMFVVMFMIYSYVDISFDARNMMLLSLALAICAFDDTPETRAEDDLDASSIDQRVGQLT